MYQDLVLKCAIQASKRFGSHYWPRSFSSVCVSHGTAIKRRSLRSTVLKTRGKCSSIRSMKFALGKIPKRPSIKVSVVGTQCTAREKDRKREGKKTAERRQCKNETSTAVSRVGKNDSVFHARESRLHPFVRVLRAALRCANLLPPTGYRSRDTSTRDIVESFIENSQRLRQHVPSLGRKFDAGRYIK